MKNQYHLLKNKKRIQMTDGSIFFLELFSENELFKLNIDPKSHVLWKERAFLEINKDSINSFMKKFNFLAN
jgi:hypothetical protein